MAITTGKKKGDPVKLRMLTNKAYKGENIGPAYGKVVVLVDPIWARRWLQTGAAVLHRPEKPPAAKVEGGAETDGPDDVHYVQLREPEKADGTNEEDVIEGEAVTEEEEEDLPGFASDPAEKFANENGVSIEELRAHGEPSGVGGYTKPDVAAFLEARAE